MTTKSADIKLKSMAVADFDMKFNRWRIMAWVYPKTTPSGTPMPIPFVFDSGTDPLSFPWTQTELTEQERRHWEQIRELRPDLLRIVADAPTSLSIASYLPLRDAQVNSSEEEPTPSPNVERIAEQEAPAHKVRQKKAPKMSLPPVRDLERVCLHKIVDYVAKHREVLKERQSIGYKPRFIFGWNRVLILSLLHHKRETTFDHLHHTLTQVVPNKLPRVVLNSSLLWRLVDRLAQCGLLEKQGSLLHVTQAGSEELRTWFSDHKLKFPI